MSFCIPCCPSRVWAAISRFGPSPTAKPNYEEALGYSMKAARATQPQGSPYFGREHVEDYLTLGFIPADTEDGSVSKTQEFAIADQANCELATRLGKSADAALACATRRNYRKLWNAEKGFFLPKNADGREAWPDFTPESIPQDVLSGQNTSYFEGNPWHYLFWAPHDPQRRRTRRRDGTGKDALTQGRREPIRQRWRSGRRRPARAPAW